MELWQHQILGFILFLLGSYLSFYIILAISHGKKRKKYSLKKSMKKVGNKSRPAKKHFNLKPKFKFKKESLVSKQLGNRNESFDSWTSFNCCFDDADEKEAVKTKQTFEDDAYRSRVSPGK